MYYFIFDAPTGPNDFQKIAKLKEIIGELGIAGEMASPMPGRGVEALIENAVKKRYTTIVAVGDTELVQSVAQAVAPHNVVFGIVPLQDTSELYSLIGVKTREEACELLKKRRYHSVHFTAAHSSMGEISFLSTATGEVAAAEALTLTTEGAKMKASGGGTLSITPGSALLQEGINFTVTLRQIVPAKRSGIIGKLLGSTPTENLTRFTCSDIRIDGAPGTPLFCAGTEIATLPATITTSSSPLRLIAKPI